MYLRTPKRYTPRGQRRRLFNLRWWWLYILTPVVVVIGAGLWQFRDQISPQIESWMLTQIANAENHVSTMQAPTPTATDSPVNYLVVANAAYERGATNEAIENYILAARGMPNDVTVHFRLVHLLATNFRTEESLEWAEKAVNADPYDPRGWAVRGMALDWAGEPERAVASLLHALELDPDNATARAFLAEAYWDMNSAQRALEAIDEALELDPNDYNVQRIYGYVMRFIDPDVATEAFERALRLAPTRAYIAADLADHYFRQGDYEAGVELLRQVVERDPDNALAHFKLAYGLYSYLGEAEQAREEVERCVVIAPESVPCLSYLGGLQLRASEYNLCARTYDQAIQAGSQNAQDYYYAGICYSVINECLRAVEVLRQGLELADDVQTQLDIRDALAGCQVVITLEPTPTPLFTETPEPEGE